jgi:hypothetical protein
MMRTTPNRRVVLAVIVFVSAALWFSGSSRAQAQPGDEAIWQQFTEWLPSSPPVDGPKELFDQYPGRV